MTEPRKLEDSVTHIFDRPMRLVERELITIWRPIGKDGAWVPISFVQSRGLA